MVSYKPSSFADLVFAGERIEAGLRKGKFNYVASANLGNAELGRSCERKKEGEPHVVSCPLPTTHQPRTPSQQQRPPLNRPQHPPTTHPISNTTPNTNQNTNQGRNFPEKKLVEFTRILISYADSLPYLLNNAMVSINPTKIPLPPFPRGYNLNVTCAYHEGVPGHSIEHCMTLKHKVQSLIDASWLRFKEDNHL
ncbi:hypothetical protein GmHk_05G013139 [Glycine max]|nr:hypothetical protein GmHk_05G013139 [Glycine max]